MKKVITFGTFDHFHAGHESYLSQAKSLGDYLIVVVARDATVRRIKGKKPTHSERERVAAVKEGKLANKVLLGGKTDKYEVIRKFKPNIIALGYDQFAFTFGLNKYIIDNKLDTKIVRLKSYKPNMYKTSIIKMAKEK